MAKPKNNIESIKCLKKRNRIFDEKVSWRENSPKVDAFLKDIVAIYDKHGMALSHEDGHGAFIVEQYKDSLVKWIWAAFDET